MQYFAQDEATRLDPTQTVYQTLAGDSPIDMVPTIRNILGGFLFSGDDIDKPVRRAVGRRAHAAGRRAHAAAAGEHAAARRADQPSRPRLEGRPARRARGLRRHADLRLARPLLRRQARDQDHRDRPRRRVESIRAPTRSSCGARQQRDGRGAAARPPAPVRGATRRSRAGADAKAERRAARTRATRGPDRAAARRDAERQGRAVLRRREEARDAEARRRQEGRRRARSAASPSSRRGSPSARRRSRSSKRRCRRPGSTTNHDSVQADHRPPPGADVGGRRPDEPVGGAASTDRSCNLCASSVPYRRSSQRRTSGRKPTQ